MERRTNVIMVTISGSRHDEPKQIIPIELTERQIKDLEEELEDYNRNNEVIGSIEEYIVFLLEVMDREIS
jgi:hypothetical protein